ncbi:MAG: DUF4202 family protein [Deltaproteobacteria bacterium]|nr:DUF4202 family protein [Deltaproteobacteria bacterium]
MDPIERARLRIAEVIAGSSIPEDPRHASNTREWLLRMDPDADAALRLAALGHDIERAISARKVQRTDFDDYDDFKAAHARNGAAILRKIMCECGFGNDALTQEVHRLVCAHEVGGDPRSDLLKDADSISYFDVNLPCYFEREGWAETRRRCTWGYLRLSGRARSIVAGLRFDEPLGELMKESIEAARVPRRSGEPC